MKTIATLLALGFLIMGGSGVYADDYYTNVTSPESEKVVSAIEKLL